MKIEPNTFICADNMDVLRELPDGFADLCLTDPPYGINAARDRKSQQWGWIDYPASGWDTERPNAGVFSKTREISRQQIIWGGNYFTDALPPSSGWIFWDKGQRDFSLADGELAWTSFNRALRVFNYSRAASLQEGKVHPTQKPVALFVWCLENYSKPGDLVIDPFCGSGTTALACHKTGRRFICIDREQKYIDIAKRRYDELTAQGDLFGNAAPVATETQTEMDL
jgi:site-specific DNA-methyltransferase (adenine-specific)